MRPRAILAAGMAWLLASVSPARADEVAEMPTAASEGAPISFVACPIVRDTETVPCWLAEYEGELYYLGIQVDIGAPWFPPQLGHEVLVEGRIADRPRICGGIVVKPLRTSVMPELNPACQTMWPAEERYKVPFAPRGPGPANRGLLRQAQRQAQDALGLPPPPQPPFEDKTFTVYFDFDTHLTPGGGPARIIGEAIRYALATKAKKVEVMAYRATSRLSNGEKLVEMEIIAERRANMIAHSLREAGIEESALAVAWKSEAEPGNGVDDPSRRRVTIFVKP